MTEPPDDNQDDDAEDGFELSEEARERLRAALAPVAKEINARLTEAVAPMAREISAQLAEALAPVARQVQQHWADAMAGVDLGPLLPAFELPPALVESLTRWRELVPPNWPRGLDVDRMSEALTDHGIALVWAPRADVVADVLAAATRTERVAVLVARRQEVVEDCRDVLAAVTSPAYDGKAVLARQALDALDAGHHQAAQALAVVVVESAVARAIHRNYDKVKRQVQVADLDEVHIADLRLRAGLAPLDRFYTPWEEGKTPHPMPDALSRHVTVHSAAPQHFTEGNAVLAVLVASTVLRALQELDEIRDSLGDPTWLPN